MLANISQFENLQSTTNRNLGAQSGMSVFNAIAPTEGFVNDLAGRISQAMADLEEFTTDEATTTTKKYATRAYNALAEAEGFVKEFVSSGATAESGPAPEGDVPPTE